MLFTIYSKGSKKSRNLAAMSSQDAKLENKNYFRTVRKVQKEYGLQLKYFHR